MHDIRAEPVNRQSVNTISRDRNSPLRFALPIIDPLALRLEPIKQGGLQGGMP
jgi:hypothetical protein